MGHLVHVVTVTPKQFRVARELARDGADNETIARRLDCSIETVRSHLSGLYERTGMQSRTELAVALARQHIELAVAPRQHSPFDATELMKSFPPAA